jgi:hypothetical protein
MMRSSFALIVPGDRLSVRHCTPNVTGVVVDVTEVVVAITPGAFDITDHHTIQTKSEKTGQVLVVSRNMVLNFAFPRRLDK